MPCFFAVCMSFGISVPCWYACMSMRSGFFVERTKSFSASYSFGSNMDCFDSYKGYYCYCIPLFTLPPQSFFQTQIYTPYFNTFKGRIQIFLEKQGYYPYNMVWNRNSSHRQGPVYCMKMPRKRRNARKYGYITEVKRRT